MWSSNWLFILASSGPYGPFLAIQRAFYNKMLKNVHWQLSGRQMSPSALPFHFVRVWNRMSWAPRHNLNAAPEKASSSTPEAIPDGLSYIGPLLVTPWTKPTPWTQPQTRLGANSSPFRPVYYIMIIKIKNDKIFKAWVLKKIENHTLLHRHCC